MTAVIQDAPAAPRDPPLAVSYASPLPRERAPRAAWAAVSGCAVGVVLLAIAAFALVSVAQQSLIPQGARRVGPMVEVIGPLLVAFAVACSLAGFAFLAFGFRSLFGPSRVGG